MPQRYALRAEQSRGTKKHAGTTVKGGGESSYHRRGLHTIM